MTASAPADHTPVEDKEQEWPTKISFSLNWLGRMWKAGVEGFFRPSLMLLLAAVRMARLFHMSTC